MKNKKQKKSYLKIPKDFNGFSYEEIRIRRAMVGLKRDALKQRMLHTVDELQGVVTGHSKSGKQNFLSRFVSIGSDSLSLIPASKLTMALKIASAGVTAYKFIQKFRNKRREKKLRRLSR